MKELLLPICLLLLPGTTFCQEFVDLLGGKYSPVIEVLRDSGYDRQISEYLKEADGQSIKFVTLRMEGESSFSKEVKLMFLSDVCVSQLYILHLHKAAELIKQLDENLIKDRKDRTEYRWFESKKYLSISYQLKKIPPDHVLTVQLDLSNAFWELNSNK